MTSVDRMGFNLRLKTDDGMKGARINFLREVSNPQETRSMLVEMVRQAIALKSGTFDGPRAPIRSDPSRLEMLCCALSGD